MMILVSVIIPNFNTAQYLAEAIDSVYNSSFKSFEIIVVDDGSTDNSSEVIEPYKSFANFNYLTQQNKGLAGARNTGINAASGKYLVFLDSDDILLPNKLNLQVTFLESNQDYDAVYSSSLFFKDGNPDIKIPTDFPNYSEQILKQLLYGNFIHVNAIMVRKDVVMRVGLFDESLRELEDWDLWLRLAIAGSKFFHQNEVLSEVRLRKGSMTSNQLKMNSTMVRVLERIIPVLKERFPYDNSLFKHANAALLQYKLLANQKVQYNESLLHSLSEVGISFLPIALKLFIKRYVSGVASFQNKTTSRLEEVWNE